MVKAELNSGCPKHPFPQGYWDHDISGEGTGKGHGYVSVLASSEITYSNPLQIWLCWLWPPLDPSHIWASLWSGSLVVQSRDSGVQSFLLHCSYIIPGTRDLPALTCSPGVYAEMEEYILAFGSQIPLMMLSTSSPNSGEGNIMWGLPQVSTQNQVCVSSLPPSSQVTIWSSLRDKETEYVTDCAFLSFVLFCVLILYFEPLAFGKLQSQKYYSFYFLVLQPTPSLSRRG